MSESHSGGERDVQAEIEITPEMVEAGEEAVREHFDPEAPGWERDVAVKVYRAMERARRAHSV